jgi:CheY-like chemotaxis protein
VDDKPDNNRNERQALTALGLSVAVCTSSDEALAVLRRRPFDVVISDLSRPEGKQAGFDLLTAIRDTGSQVPYIVYAGSARPPSPTPRAEAPSVTPPTRARSSSSSPQL